MTSKLLRIDVLGPLRVVDEDGRDLTPTGSLQRRLLALLVLWRGRVVAADAAIDALWPSWPSAEVAYSANRFIHKLVDTNAFGAP